ncbi:MAG: hypothetical protein WAX77_02835 [Methylococcaceae bacterium]
MKTIKKILISTALLLTSVNVLAAAQNGSLGASATATDYYEVKCSKNTAGDTSYLQFSIKDLPPAVAPIINAQITKGIKALSTSDNTDNDTVYSSVIKAAWGNGSYFVSVNKTKAGAELYTFNFACMTAKNTLAGTAIVSPAWQNQ